MADDAGFDAFYLRAYPSIVGALTHVLADEQLAEDLAQEALIRAFSRWDRVSVMRSPVGWAVHVGTNLARSALRRRIVQRRVHRRLAVDVAQPVERDLSAALEARALLDELTVPQREIIVLRYVVGLDSNDAAEVLGITATSVRQRTHRALTRLRVHFPADGSNAEVRRGC